MSDLAAGVYKHYKGGLYMLLGVAEHTETGERLVVYVPLAVQPGAPIKVRPYGMFTDQVTIDGITKPRFVHIGQAVGDVFAQFYDAKSGYRGGDRVDH